MNAVTYSHAILKCTATQLEELNRSVKFTFNGAPHPKRAFPCIKEHGMQLDYVSTQPPTIVLLPKGGNI